LRVGAGVRSAYAHSDEVSLERLELAARAAANVAEQRGAAIALPATHAAAAAHDLYPVARPPIDTPTADQVALLQRLDAAARGVDPCITNVFAGIGIEHRVVLVVTSAGAVVGDVRPLVHLSVTCIAERGGRREQGSYGGGGPPSPPAPPRASPRSSARWSTTGRSRIAAARSTSTTRARPRSARCSSSAASCAAISRTASTRRS